MAKAFFFPPFLSWEGLTITTFDWKRNSNGQIWSTFQAENTEDSIFYELTGLKKRVKSPGISMHTH